MASFNSPNFKVGYYEFKMRFYVVSAESTTMSRIAVSLQSLIKVAPFLLLALAGCGLAIDNADRVARAEQALADEEYRAAIIDAKAVLRDEPENVAARLILGRASIRSGDPVGAEYALRRAVDLGISAEDVVVDLGSALLGLGRYDAVIEEIKVGLARTEEDGRSVNMLRGHAYLGLEKSQDARESFSSVLSSDDSDIEAQLGVASAYVQEENFIQARATLDFVSNANVDEVLPQLASAELAMHTRDWSRAELDYRRALGLAQEQTNEGAQLLALSGLGNVALAQSNVDGAREVAAQLSELAPDSLYTKELAARIAFVDQDWSVAQSNLQEILSQAPEYQPAQILLGAAHLQSGNLAQAEMYLSAVVAITPTNADARRYLAETRYRMDKSDEARETLQPLLDEDAPSTRLLGMAASISLNAGDFDYAAQYLQRAVEAEPDNVDAQMALTVAYLMAGRNDEAQQILDLVGQEGGELNRLRRDVLSVISTLVQDNTEDALAGARKLASDWPDDPTALNLAGAVELSEGNHAAARANFEVSHANAPDNLMSVRYLAMVDEAQGEFVAAMDRYRSIIAERPRDVSAMLASARLSALLEDYIGAKSWLEKAIAAAGEQSLAPRLSLGRMLLTTADFEGARQAADDTLEEFADSAEAAAIRGYAQIGLDNGAAAIESFDKAIALDPGHLDYAIALARAEVELGEDDQAAKTIEEAYNSETTSVPIAVLRATQLMNAGDSGAAIKIAKDLQRALPNNPIALALEAEILVKDERLTEAVQLYDQALAIENTAEYAFRAYKIRSQMGVENRVVSLINYLQERPLNNEVRLVLAQAYDIDGEGEKAVAEYEKVMDVAPDNYVAANNLAWLYFIAHDVRAETVARRAYDLAPDDGSTADTLGWILINKGVGDEGLELLHKADKLTNGSPDVRYHLAVALAESGEKQRARRMLTEVLNSDLEFAGRQKAKEFLTTL